jgi:MFS transporter, MHS family, shikimate and dehydroshikimate transport protein
VIGISGAQGIVFALHASFMPELFSAKVRYTGISIGFQIGAAIGGGLTPLAAAATVGWGTWPISLMLSLLGVLTLIAILKTGETSKRSMIA